MSEPRAFLPQWKWRFVDGTQPLPAGAVVVDDPVLTRCWARQYEEWTRRVALSDGDLAWEIFVLRAPPRSENLYYPFNGPLPEGWKEKLAVTRKGYEQWIAERGPTAERQTLIREPYSQVPPRQTESVRQPEPVTPRRCVNPTHHRQCHGGGDGCNRGP